MREHARKPRTEQPDYQLQTTPILETAQPDKTQLNKAQLEGHSGQTLDGIARNLLEPGFGHSFDKIKIHSDAQADRLAKSMEAAAFTVGQDVFFREALYDPHSRRGLHLLAHELTHTIQQGDVKLEDKALEKLEFSQPTDTSELEAQGASEAVMAGQFAPTLTSSQPSVQRFSASNNDTKDAESSVYWDTLGLIPGPFGQIATAAATATDLGESGIDLISGDTKSATSHWHNAEQDALGAIPGFGTELGMVELAQDQEVLRERLHGANAKEAPTSSDMFDEYVGPVLDMFPSPLSPMPIINLVDYTRAHLPNNLVDSEQWKQMNPDLMLDGDDGAGGGRAYDSVRRGQPPGMFTSWEAYDEWKANNPDLRN